METKVSLLNDYDMSDKVNKRCYLIQIKKNFLIWYVTKRYRQILNLKLELEKRHQIKIPDFPVKKMLGSYSRNITDQRVNSFNLFFRYINSRENLVQDHIYDKFFRSDIYLDSYRDIQQSDILKNTIVKSETLNLALNDLTTKVETLEDEVNNLQDKLKIIRKNIASTRNSNKEKLDYLIDLENGRKNSHVKKNELVDEIMELTKFYYILRQKCCLVKNLKIGNMETINEYEILSSEIRLELMRINNWIKDLDDKFVNHYWKIDDYIRISNLLETRLIPKLKQVIDKKN